MKEIVLSNGITVRVEMAPVLAVNVIVRTLPECQYPPRPVEVIEGKAGRTEAMARPGTTEYSEWQRELQRVENTINDTTTVVGIYLGIVEWKHPSSDEWTDCNLCGWELPRKITRTGIEPRSGEIGKYLDWIQYHLVRNGSDIEALTDAVIQGPEISLAEVEATRDSFQAPEKGDADTDSSGE